MDDIKGGKDIELRNKEVIFIVGLFEEVKRGKFE